MEGWNMSTDCGPVLKKTILATVPVAGLLWLAFGKGAFFGFLSGVALSCLLFILLVRGWTGHHSPGLILRGFLIRFAVGGVGCYAVVRLRNLLSLPLFLAGFCWLYVVLLSTEIFGVATADGGNRRRIR